MRIKKKSLIGKLAIATVSIILVLMLFWRNDATIEFDRLPIKKYGFQKDLPGAIHSALDFAHNIVTGVGKCASSISNLKITANYTMNSVLDNLVISYRPWDNSNTHVPSGAVPMTEPLQIIVMPHSHNDPGWKKTYQGYFDDQTTHILTNMVKKMQQYPEMTFVWVESCFLDKWWSNQTDDTRMAFRELVDSGRLEITSGMWVAPDEASPHYFALVDQLIEGHYWVKKNLGVVPESSLNFDQFGYSSTMPFLAKKAGLKNVLIKRIHRAVKELFGQQNKMNFHWRQFWDPHGENDIFTHIDTYEWMSISDSCGPDRQVCNMLDFKNHPELPNPDSQEATKDHGRSLQVFVEKLIKQFRMKNANYKYRVMMMPHGGDFRYDTAEEWDLQYRNLQIFMKYVNSHKDLNVRMRFGTLKDYFEEIENQNTKYDLQYPVVSGDFYTYTESTEYWTGYFTTRQFDKRLGREVLESLRAAELFTSILLKDPYLNIRVNQTSRTWILESLVTARQNLGVFQHHDAITGTSQAHVAADYEMLLSSAFTLSQSVLAFVINNFLSKSDNDYLYPVLNRPGYNKLTEQAPVYIKSYGTHIVVVNSLLQPRTEVVTVTVQNPHVHVYTPKGSHVEFDVFSNPSGTYDIQFLVDFPALSVITYLFKQNIVGQSEQKTTSKKDKHADRGELHVCQNAFLNVTFSGLTGSPVSVCHRENDECNELKLDWIYYPGYGGAYTMMSGGAERQAGKDKPHVTLKTSKYKCGVEVNHEFFSVKIFLSMTSGVTSRALEVEVISDILKTSQFVGDLAMRVKTKINSKDIFYVDSNGLQLMGRKFRKNIPFDGNVYPMSSMAILEDNALRLVVHSAQPHGVVSRQSGVIDFMLDRLQTRPEMDMPEPVKDNKPTKTSFFLELAGAWEFEPSDTTETTLPTVNSMFLNDVLQHPIYSFYATSEPEVSKMTFLQHPVSCDIVVANVKNLVYSQNVPDGTSLTLYRRGVGCPQKTVDHCSMLSSEYIQPASMFYEHKALKVTEMYLSHLITKQILGSSERVRLQPMDIKTFHIENEY